MNRAATLKVNKFPYLSRLKDVRSVVKDQSFQSKQLGKRENKYVNMEGRVQFDLLQVSCVLCLLTYNVLCIFLETNFRIGITSELSLLD